MEKQSVIIYFNGGEKQTFVAGNYELSGNKIDDYNMSKLNTWTKNPSTVCEIQNIKGITYRIFPSNVNYIKITKE